MGAKPTIAQNVGLLTAANLLMRGVSMLFQVYLTARVGAAGVGLLQLILSVNLFAVTLGTSGLRVAALYLSAEAYGLRRYGGVRQAMVWCLTAGLLLSALVGGAMMAFAEPLALSVVGDLRAGLSLRLRGLTLPLSCLSMILSGCFTACGQVSRASPGIWPMPARPSWAAMPWRRWGPWRCCWACCAVGWASWTAAAPCRTWDGGSWASPGPWQSATICARAWGPWSNF